MWGVTSFWGMIFLGIAVPFVCTSFDMTTVYRNFDVDTSEPIGKENEVEGSKSITAECHARTNALGLPFMTPDGSTIDPNVGVDVPSCHNPNCSWSYKHWVMMGDVARFQLPPLNLPPEVYKFSTDGASLSDYIPVAHTSLTFTVRTATKGVVRVLLLTQPDVETSDLYLIELVHNELFKVHLSSVLFKCGTGSKYKHNVPIVPKTGTVRHCLAVGNQHLLWTKDQELKFEMNLAGNRLEIFRDGQYSPLVTELDEAKLNINYIAFLTEDIARNWTVTLEPRAFVLEKSGGVLSSPIFVPTFDKICLSFFSFIERELSSTISVTAKFGGGNIREVGIIEHNEERSWRYQRIVLNLESLGLKTGETVQIFIHGETIYHPSTISLHGLMGCNPFDDEEDIALIKVPASNRFICSVGQKEKPVEQVIAKSCPTCLHGGECNNATGACTCPPGFIGIRCQDGCGRNSFGSDCRGFCSGHAIGCWGMELCTQGLGCNCAPGFTGKLCNVSCPSGRYGINCSENCAMCADDTSCDMYTGVCYQGCKKGFNPPLCMTPIRYLSRPPNVTSIDVNTMRVSFITRDEDLAGEGTPMFYHVQYRGLNDTKWLSAPPEQLPEKSTTVAVTHLVKFLTPGKTYLARVLLYNEDGDSYTNSSVIPITKFETECEIPVSPKYNLKAAWNQKNGFNMEWKYDSRSKTACEVEYFKVYIKEGWRRYMYCMTNESHVVISERSPDSQYRVEVEAVTNHGPAPLSENVLVTTAQGAPSAVLKLHYRRVVPTELEVMWQRPKITGGQIKHYIIKYQCLRYLACGEGINCSSGGVVTSEDTNVHLTGLLPFSQYEIQVAGFTVEEGPFVKIVAATLHTDPEVAPAPSPVPMTVKTTRKLTFNWLPAADCRLLNGYPVGFQFSLIAEIGGDNLIVSSGNSSESKVTFQGLAPHTEYELRVIQVVTGGHSNFKHQLVIRSKTRGLISPPVRDLFVTDMGNAVTHLEWSPPLNSQNMQIHHYIIIHKCVRLLACAPDVKCNNSTGTITTPDLFLTLTDLLPFAAIQIQVAAFTGEIGIFSGIAVKTSPAAPRTLPTAASKPIFGRGATWIAIEWLPPSNCTLLNGPLVGYSYRLTQIEDNKSPKVVMEGWTTNNMHTYNFTNLAPHTQFIAGVTALVSIHNFSSRPLNYNVWTRFSAPKPVEDLSLFQQDLTHMGLKWKAPEFKSGLVDSVVVRFSPNTKDEMKLIKMVRCAIWETYFCYNLTGLQPNINYNITVQVWNTDNKEAGEMASISVNTTQTVPNPPSFLNVVSRNITSLVISWGFPTLTSGKVTTFHVRYHQFESFRMWECCDDAQTNELQVEDERRSYSMQLVGLKVASKYVVQVSTVTTSFTSEPITVESSTMPGSPWMDGAGLHIVPGSITNTSAEFVFKQVKNKDGGPISGYFIVVTTPYLINNSLALLAPRVKQELDNVLGTTRYIALELLGIEVEGTLAVTLGTGSVMYGVYGRFVNYPLRPNTSYGLRLLVLSEYMEDRSYRFVDAEPFTTLA